LTRNHNFNKSSQDSFHPSDTFEDVQNLFAFSTKLLDSPRFFETKASVSRQEFGAVFSWDRFLYHSSE